MESQEIPGIKNTDHSLDFLDTRKKSSTRGKERQSERKTIEGERARLRAYERGRVGFHENSCRSFEASSLVRASHLAESESPGRPCSDAQVHAGQDSPFASPASSLSLSFSPSTFYYHRHHHYHHHRHHHRRSTRQGRAPSPSPSSFLRPLAPPRHPHFPPRTPRSRRQHLTSLPRTPSPPSSFQLSFSFSYLPCRFLLRRLFDLTRNARFPYFSLLAR